MGESGDQSRGAGILTVRASWGPVASATASPASATRTLASPARSAAPSGVITMRTVPSVCGVILSAAMESSGTCSSQTVCQMPETGVYQMPPGSVTCLPWSCQAVSVASVAFTTRVLSPGLRAAVMSNENGR